MNPNKPPFDDRKVRQAFNYTVDKETLWKDILGKIPASETIPISGLIPATGLLPPGFPGYNEDLEGYDFDLIRAQQLLEESRYGANIFEEFPLIRLNYIGSESPGVGKITLFWGENFVKKSTLWTPLTSLPAIPTRNMCSW